MQVTEPTIESISESLKHFFRNAPIAIAVFDSEMRYVAWSREWSRLYGLGERDLRGQSHYAVFPDLAERWRDAHRRGLLGETVSNERDSYKTADGQVVWIRWRVVPVVRKDEQIDGITLYTEDITERILAQEEARIGNERLKQITSSLGIGIFEHDFDSGLSTISDGYLSLLQLDRSKVPTTPEEWVSLLRPTSVERYLESRRLALDPAGDGRFFTDVRPIVAGQERMMQIHSRVLFNGEGAQRRPQRVIGILVDQTAGLQMQEALSRAQRLETVGRMAGMVAHDFNNILTVILASLELADLRSQDPEIRQLLSQATDAALMGAGFNKRLLALAGGHRGTAVPTVLDEHFSRTWEVFSRVLSDEIVLRFEPHSGGAMVSIDPAEMDGALLNLIVNARDAQPEGGTIEVRTARVTLDAAGALAYHGGKPGNFLRLSVIDHGLGMAEDVARRAIEPFFSTKGRDRGTGLGLTSVAMTADRAGGFLHIASAPGQGTEVMLFLPVLSDTDVAARLAETEAIPFGNGELVLVVEDDAMVRETVLQRLEAIGYAVLEASNAHNAMTLIEAGEPVDLVFSDVVMPGHMSGYDLARAVMAEHPGIAVLLTSGHVSQTFRNHASNGPSVPLLSKPYLLRDLAVAVSAALKPPAPSAELRR